MDQQAIDRAIRRGVVYLKSAQYAPTAPGLGGAAVAGLALLECGVPADDPAVQRLAWAVRKGSISLNPTFSLSMAITFLDRLGDPRDVPLIESMLVRLLSGQDRSGGWGGLCARPIAGPSDVNRLTGLLGRWDDLKPGRDVPAPGKKRTPADLPADLVGDLKAIEQYRPLSLPQHCTTFDTDFAMLGLWVGQRYAVPVRIALVAGDQYLRRSQLADNGWGGGPDQPMAPGSEVTTASATAAGLLGLSIGYGAAIESVLKKVPGAPPVRDFSKDAALRRGLAVLGGALADPLEDESRPEQPRRGPPLGLPSTLGGPYYFLWSLERVGVAYGLKAIGKKDWYLWGARYLLAHQGADGGWSRLGSGVGRPGLYASLETPFALLFLRQGGLTKDLPRMLQGQIHRRGQLDLETGIIAPQSGQQGAS